MRAEVRANVEREVKKRVEARLKAQALQALLDATPLELPKSLMQMETQRLVRAGGGRPAGARHEDGAAADRSAGLRGEREAPRRARR